jgi:rubrerythrin
MVVKNECQALCIAVEMERRAIRVYERALMLTTDEQVRRGINEILSDERRHLQRFSEMRACHQLAEAEERLLISSMAAEVLFTGGVMEMKREQALTTLRGLYQYAADSEADAVRTYADFAKKCTDPALHDVFMDIVREESSHLVELRGKLTAM